MAPGMTPTKRFAIRASLISGSTVALIVGAQTLITVDVQAGRMTQGGSSIAVSDSNSGIDSSSGVTVIRQGNAPTLFFSGDDDSFQNQDDIFNQQLQSQFNQQQSLSSQRSLFRPRTHSSR